VLERGNVYQPSNGNENDRRQDNLWQNLQKAGQE
jgi:hypothetical protein